MLLRGAPLLGNIYTMGLWDLVTFLSGYKRALLSGDLLTLFSWDVSAMLLLNRPTFLSWHLPCNFTTVRLWYVVTFSLCGWFALLMGHFVANWLVWLTDLSGYFATAVTCTMRPSSQGTKAKRTGKMSVSVISCLAVAPFLSLSLLSLSLTVGQVDVTVGVVSVAVALADCLVHCPTERLQGLTLLGVSDMTLLRWDVVALL